MTEPPAAPEIAGAARIAGEVTVSHSISIDRITEHGMQFAAPFVLHNDSLHDFRLALDHRSIVVKARVLRCQVGELTDGVVLYRCDVEFVEPAPHAVRTIAEFLTVRNAPPPRVIDGEIS